MEVLKGDFRTLHNIALDLKQVIEALHYVFANFIILSHHLLSDPRNLALGVDTVFQLVDALIKHEFFIGPHSTELGSYLHFIRYDLVVSVSECRFKVFFVPNLVLQYNADLPFVIYHLHSFLLLSDAQSLVC